MGTSKDSPAYATGSWSWREQRTPTDAIAELFRARRIASHALRDYIDRGFREEDRKGLRRLRKSAVQPILKALANKRPWSAAERECKSQMRRLNQDPKDRDKRRVAFEIGNIVLPLLKAYRNPRHFFETLAPQICPEDFSERHLLAGDIPTLPLSLRRWGIAAFLNPAVADAFASPFADIVNVLAQTKEQPTFTRRGPKRRVHRGPRGPKIDWNARKDFFAACVAVLNPAARIPPRRVPIVAKILGRKRFASLDEIRQNSLSKRAAIGQAYLETASNFRTTVPALKRAFRRHRNSI